MSHAQTLLRLTHNTNQALREGRLGAQEWFNFLNSIEMLAKTMQLHEAREKKSHLKIADASSTSYSNANSSSDTCSQTATRNQTVACSQTATCNQTVARSQTATRNSNAACSLTATCSPTATYGASDIPPRVANNN